MDLDDARAPLRISDAARRLAVDLGLQGVQQLRMRHYDGVRALARLVASGRLNDIETALIAPLLADLTSERREPTPTIGENFERVAIRAALDGVEPASIRNAVAEYCDDEACPDCNGRGWDVFNLDEDDPFALGEIQRCDACEKFDSDEDAQRAACEAGLELSVTRESYTHWAGAAAGSEL